MANLASTPRTPGDDGWTLMSPSIVGHERLKNAFNQLSDDERSNFQARLALAANMALSADRVELWDEARFANPSSGAFLLSARTRRHWRRTRRAQRRKVVGEQFKQPHTIRIGHGRILDSVSSIHTAVKHQYLVGPASSTDGVDIAHLRRWSDALTRRHPATPDDDFPVNHQPGIDGIHAQLIADLGHATHRNRPVEIGVGAWTAQFCRAILHIDGLVHYQWTAR